MSENSKLYTNVRDGRMSVSFFKRENITDKGEVVASYGACVQRSYQKPENKGTDKWERETINLFPDEVLKLSALLVRGYNGLIHQMQVDKELEKHNTGNNYPSQTINNDEPPAWTTQDMPL